MNPLARNLSSGFQSAAGDSTIAATPAPAAGDAASSVQVPSVPSWWTTSSLEAFFRHESSQSEGMYPPGGFTNFLRSDQSPSHRNENFHFVGTTKRKSATSPIAPSSEQTPIGGDKETIDVDAADDENPQDPRTDKRLPYTKAEDIRLGTAWLRNWEKCPYAWKGMYTRGDHGVPTIILEAVASHDRWIWHAFFGVAGSNNDINVLNQSHLFVEQLRGEAPKVDFSINGRQYNIGYYLADGIYPEWPVFVKSIREPQSDKRKLFAEKQEGARKDVECAFGILQSRFCILRRPARLYEQGDLENIMLACIILHNMIIEDEKDIEQVPLDLNEEATTYTVQEATISCGENPEMEDILNRNTALQDRQAYKQLQNDLIDHIWHKFENSSRQNN